VNSLEGLVKKSKLLMIGPVRALAGRQYSLSMALDFVLQFSKVALQFVCLGSVWGRTCNVP